VQKKEWHRPHESDDGSMTCRSQWLGSTSRMLDLCDRRRSVTCTAAMVDGPPARHKGQTAASLVLPMGVHDPADSPKIISVFSDALGRKGDAMVLLLLWPIAGAAFLLWRWISLGRDESSVAAYGAGLRQLQTAARRGARAKPVSPVAPPSRYPGLTPEGSRAWRR